MVTNFRTGFCSGATDRGANQLTERTMLETQRIVEWFTAPGEALQQQRRWMERYAS